MLHSLVRTFVSWLELSIFLNLKDETTKVRIAAPEGTFLALKKVSVASTELDQKKPKGKT